MTFRNKFFAVALATCAVVALPVNGANAEEKMNPKDKAADSVIITKTTYSYDMNNDGYIDPTEFSSYITKTTDSNRDGYLEVTEYDSSSMTYFHDYMKANEKKETTTYSYWDKDKDNRLDAGEVETLVANTGVYKKWDKNLDGKIDPQEFSKGTFSIYDDNKDGTINPAEWSDVVM